MQNFSITSNPPNAGPRRGFLGLDMTGLAAIVVGAGVTLGTLHLAIVRPVTQEFANLRSQVKTLSADVERLTGQRDMVTGTNSLLAELAEQGRRNREAAASLENISALHERLNEQTARAEQALLVMEKLASLQDGLLAKADDTACGPASARLG